MKTTSKTGLILSLAIAGGLAGACQNPAASSPAHPRPNPQLLTAGGVEIQPCKPEPQYAIVARIKIVSDNRYLFDAKTPRVANASNPKFASVTYWKTSQDTDVEDKNRTYETYDSSPNVANNPYDFDLQSLENNDNSLSGKWARIRVILDNSGNSKNKEVSFTPVTLESNDENTDEICAAPQTSNLQYFNNADNDDEQVAIFYVKIGGNTAKDGTRHINIGVISNTDSTGTPIFIDPKIPNNG